LTFLTILFKKRTDTRAGAHARERMIKKDDERDNKDGNSGYLDSQRKQTNAHTHTQTQIEKVARGCRLLYLWHTSHRASNNVYKCGGMVHLMMQPCTYTL
jgi:hypothetical protein